MKQYRYGKVTTYRVRPRRLVLQYRRIAALAASLLLLALAIGAFELWLHGWGPFGH